MDVVNHQLWPNERDHDHTGALEAYNFQIALYKALDRGSSSILPYTNEMLLKACPE
mgnify:CR=1 FL=1